jgi:magnesium transporter
MLRAFDNQDDKLRIISAAKNTRLNEEEIHNALWIDLSEATKHDKQLVERLARTDLPESGEVQELESSSRFFEDEEGLHVHSLFLYPSEGRYKTANVAFTLQKERLISTRENPFPVFRLMRLRCRAGRVETQTPAQLLLTLMEYKVDHLADTIEDLYRDVDAVSHKVLQTEAPSLEEAIDELADIEDTNGKVRLSLMDTQRAVSFLARFLRGDSELRELCSEIYQDVESLLQHTNFVFEKVNFLMDAAQGFINIEQNKIIKTFSIASVVFLPPTLVASMYGMNFDFMPELNMQYGYPMTVCFMVLAGLLPLWYFKRKGWL